LLDANLSLSLAGGNLEKIIGQLPR
jgi:hypothetical protein